MTNPSPSPSPNIDEKTHRLRLNQRFAWQQHLASLVTHPEKRFIVAVLGRRAGKTEACSDITGIHALETPGSYFWGAPTYDLASIGRDRFNEMFSPVITRSLTQPPEARIIGGSTVRWRSFDRPGAALGRGNRLVIVDEGARVKEEMIMEELLPTVADTGGKVVAITTPRGRRNWIYRWYRKAKEGDPLYGFVHGPSTANPSPLIQAYVDIARSNMPSHLFKQEILAEFIEGEGSVFRNITRCATLPPTPPLRPAKDDRSVYIGAADLAKHQDWTVLMSINAQTGDIAGFERFQELAWPLQEQRIMDFHQRWNQCVMWIDSTGVGDPVFDRLIQSGMPAVPFKFTNENKAQLVMQLSQDLDAEAIHFPNLDLIINELEMYGYEVLPSGRFRYGAASESDHDDIVTALMLLSHARKFGVADLGGTGWG